MTDCLKVGTIAAVHGINGAVRVPCDKDTASAFMTLRSVQLKRSEPGLNNKAMPPPGQQELPLPQQLHIQRIKYGKRCLLIEFSEVTDRTMAEALVGTALYTERRQVGALDKNEWWSCDLIGLPAFKTSGEFIGTICDIISSPADLLEIKPANASNDATILVPFVEALVPKVDLKGKRVEIADIPGLID